MGFFSLGLILVNFIVSYKGFNDLNFYYKYNFRVDKILQEKDYKRLVTSGFLHVNWSHLVVNLIALFFFSASLEGFIGDFKFFLVYFSWLIGGNLFSLVVHKNDKSYSAVGASGAVAGILFSLIAIFPGMDVRFFLLPFSFPVWVLGLIFLAVSLYGTRVNKKNIGHEASLGGALIGFLVGLALHPQSIMENPVVIMFIFSITIALIILVIKNPSLIFIKNNFYNSAHLNIDDRYNIQKLDKQKQLDAILEKIHRKGMNSLSAKEREILEEFSKK